MRVRFCTERNRERLRRANQNSSGALRSLSRKRAYIGPPPQQYSMMIAMFPESKTTGST